MRTQEADGNGEEVTRWANGVTIKKTRDGYSWTVAIAAADNSSEAMKAAVGQAIEIEGQLSALYGPKDGHGRKER